VRPAPGPGDGPSGFWQATLDALSDSVAVLDEVGGIVAVNRAWRSFAEANDGGGRVGVDYLAVCDRASVDEPTAADVAAGLRAVIAGACTAFERVYACHAPWQQRWFSMRAAAFDADERRYVIVTHQDVSALHEAERVSSERAELLDVVDTAVIATDAFGSVTAWNGGAERVIGWTAEEAVGRQITELAVQPSNLQEAAEIRASVRATGRWDGRFEVTRKDGSHFPGLVTNVAIHAADGTFAGVVGALVDLTASVVAERRLRGARDFLATVTHTMPDGLVVLDGEGRVTLVNEGVVKMLGWSEAELLGELKHEMIHTLRPDGTSHPSAECPITLARQAGTSVRVDDDTFQCRDGSFLPVAYSAASFITESGESGSVVVFNDITERKAQDLRTRRELAELTWVGHIRDALREDRFVLYAQPIVDVGTGATVQHELLVRMLGAEGEVIPPGTFLPVAEQYGLIAAIDARVLEMALPFAASGHAIAINLSADSISDAGLFRLFEAHLKVLCVDARLVVIEITETALIENEAVARTFIEKVRGLGCGVALDDFGTGYGNLRSLKHLPVTLVKIDKEFVTDLGEAAADVNGQVTEAIVRLAAGLGQQTVGEGVETLGALEALRRLGVDFAQGYYFGRPAPAAETFQAIAQCRGAL